jgi:glutaminyl-tRNA synthetase
MHWLSAAHSLPAEVRLYGPLFAKPEPRSDENFAADLNPNSIEVLPDARIEPSLLDTQIEVPVQFERQGYFCRDRDSTPEKPVFIRTIGLRDTFAREAAKDQGKR